MDNDENVASFKNTEHTKFKTKVQKPCPVLDKNDQNSISHLSVCKEPYPLRLDTLIPIRKYSSLSLGRGKYRPEINTFRSVLCVENVN